MSRPSDPPRGAAGLRWLQGAVLVLAGAWALSPALRGPWLWDDDQYVTRNLALHSAAGLWKNWLAPTTVNYFPVTTTVQWLQWRAWGGNPFGYHATNLFLHLLSGLLVWRLLAALFRERAPAAPGPKLPAAAWAGALIFVVHPLVVESVAWISELKNTLSLPLLLLAMIFYLDWDQRQEPDPAPAAETPPAAPGRRAGSYRLALACFVAAMLAKSTVAMFPAVILLHAWWRRGRIRRTDLRSSAPFFAVSLLLGSVTVVFEHHRSMSGVLAVPGGGLLERTVAAGPALVFYLSKCLWPRDLSLIYPQWPVDSLLRPALSWALLALLGGVLWSRRNRWGRPALFALGFFALNLLPVLGIVPIAYQDISPVADHLVYLPLLGLVGLGAAAIGRLRPRRAEAAREDPPENRRRHLAWSAAIVAAGGVAASMALATRSYAKVFANAESLWSRAAAHSPRSWIPENNLGLVLAGAGRQAEAIAHFQRARAIDPHVAEVEANLGLALAGADRLPEAIVHDENALRLNPDFPEADNNLGLALARAGRKDEAVQRLEQAIRLRPDYPEAHRNLGLVLATEGRLDEAVAELESAIRIDPGYAEARGDLGLVLHALGRQPPSP